MTLLLPIRIRPLPAWSNKLFPMRRRRWNATQRRNQKENITKVKLKTRIRRLRAEMVEIGEEQKKIKEGKRQVRNKYQELKAEQEQLKMEANLISQQTLSIQQRLILLVKIFKPKVDNDFAKATQLSQSLRDLIENQNVPK